MNYKTWRRSIGAVLITAMVLTFAGCADGDYTTVRIETGIDTQHITLLDKVLKFVSMSRNLHAQETPVDIDNLTIKVSGPGMETIEEFIVGSENIPPVVTLFVPSGENRKIEVVAVVNPDAAAAYDIGGVVTKNLVPGEQVLVEMYMLGIPDNVWGLPGYPVDWTYEEASNVEVSGFEIYSAEPKLDEFGDPIEGDQPPDSDYTRIYRGAAVNTFENFYEATETSGDTYKWFKVRAYKDNVYGLFSQPSQAGS